MRGWLLASVDGQQMGIIPANYVKILGKRRGTKNNPSQRNSNQSLPALPQPSTSNSSSAWDQTWPNNPTPSSSSGNVFEPSSSLNQAQNNGGLDNAQALFQEAELSGEFENQLDNSASAMKSNFSHLNDNQSEMSKQDDSLDLGEKDSK